MAICWIFLERSKEDSVTASRGALVSLFFTICAILDCRNIFYESIAKIKLKRYTRGTGPEMSFLTLWF